MWLEETSLPLHKITDSPVKVPSLGSTHCQWHCQTGLTEALSSLISHQKSARMDLDLL